jgi:hypothetical protein
MAWFVVVIRDGESNDVVLDEFPGAEEARLYALAEARLRESSPTADQVRITVGEVQDSRVVHLGGWLRSAPAGWVWRSGEEMSPDAEQSYSPSAQNHDVIGRTDSGDAHG